VEGLKLIDSSFKLFSPLVRSQEACSKSRAEKLFNAEEEKPVRKVEKKPTRNNRKKGNSKRKNLERKLKTALAATRRWTLMKWRK
jgi:hypothetical protein